MENEAKSKVTLAVIVPIYQGVSTLSDTLDSLLAQTEAVDEVIVVDDGSTDGGAEIAARHPLRPRLIRQANRGVAVARNVGALSSSCDFIAFLDQDDLWMADRCRRLKEFLASSGELAIVTTEKSFFLERDAGDLAAMREPMHAGATFRNVIDLGAIVRQDDVESGRPKVLRRFSTVDLLGGPVALTTSYVVNRSLYFAVGGHPTFARSHDDYWLLLNLSRVTDVPFVDEASVLYRIHAKSNSMTTMWSRPLLASQVAARHGANLVPADEGRSESFVGRLNDARHFWESHILNIARSTRGAGGFADAMSFVRLLATSRGERRVLRWRVTKAWIRSKILRR